MAAALSASAWPPDRDNDVLFSVFPRAHFTTPTPETTPVIGTLASPQRAFGGFQSSDDAADKAVVQNRAWSAATKFLSLAEIADKIKVSRDGTQALLLLLRSPGPGSSELLDWYSHEIGVHFRNFVLPELNAWRTAVPLSEASQLIQHTIATLRKARKHYLERLYALEDIAHDEEDSSSIVQFRAQVIRNLHVLLLHSLPVQRLQKTLTAAMYQYMQSALAENSSHDKCVAEDQCHCNLEPDGFPFAALHEVGLGDAVGERAFAHAVHRFLGGPAIERRCFEVDWNGHQPIVEKLRNWVKQYFSPFAERVLAALTGNASFELSQQDRNQFDTMAITQIGRLRTHSLFDYIKTWPQSTGAILDIKAYINIKDYIGTGGPSEKAIVCHAFMEQIQRRFLHAGASTSEILSIYINVIHAFKTLDARGVLLGKVATPIRNYLRARDDTVNIIAASFLADVGPDLIVKAPDMHKICPDITLEVINSTLDDGRDRKMLNWNDLDWVPDPIDAGPEYKSSKSDDVVAYVLGLFEQDEFIKEITTVLAQMLLHATDAEYVKETRLVELLKSRLDATKLQAAEVMLKDVRDSVTLGKRINPLAIYESRTLAVPTPKEIQEAIPDEGITLASLYNLFSDRMKRAEFLAVAKLVSHRRNDLLFPKRTRQPSQPDVSRPDKSTTNFKAQIVSSFFWPQLRDDEFRMAPRLETMCAEFNEHFRRLGNQRKLHFRPALARISLRLDLEDRTIEEVDLPGWRASVIDAFGTQQPSEEHTSVMDSDSTTTFTADQLVEALQMDEELVADALSFWTSKRVLYQPSPGIYAVLERLDMDVGATAAAEQDPMVVHRDEVSAVRSQDALLREAAPMFQAFIANMLRNGGPKEIEGMMGITAVLRMVNPAFTYGDDEVRWLLTEMEGRGEVRRAGEMWAAV